MTTAPSRMTAQEIEQELFELREDERRDRTRNGNRDFTMEALTAQNDSTRGSTIAAEIRAEGTLYARRCRERAERIAALEGARAEREQADVSKELEALSASHKAAMTAARKARAGIDFGLLDAFEAQVGHYLQHAQAARNAAVEAATVAKRGKAPAPGLLAPKSERVESLYPRLQRLAGRTSAPDLQSRRDLSALDVQRITLD